jgi:hypothetical protein
MSNNVSDKKYTDDLIRIIDAKNRTTETDIKKNFCVYLNEFFRIMLTERCEYDNTAEGINEHNALRDLMMRNITDSIVGQKMISFSLSYSNICVIKKIIRNIKMVFFTGITKKYEDDFHNAIEKNLLNDKRFLFEKLCDPLVHCVRLPNNIECRFSISKQCNEGGEWHQMIIKSRKVSN